MAFKSRESGKNKSKIKEKGKKNPTSGLPPTKRFFRLNSLTFLDFLYQVDQKVAVNASLKDVSSSEVAYRQLVCEVDQRSAEHQQGETQVWVEYSFYLHNHQKNKQALDEKLVAC